MNSIAIITARGGSKRIPQKNIRNFCGKPIIAYSIEAALDSNIFDTVMVSTDSEEIAEISMQYGAAVPFLRSKETADDFSTTADVLYEVINGYLKQGIEYTYACCIYPTAPFVTKEKLSAAMKIIKQEDADSVIPIVKYGFPPQRAFILDNGKVKYKWSDNINARSQDLEPFYHDCGQFYAFKVFEFLENKNLITKKTIPIIVKETEVQDIDNFEDWSIAEMKYKLMMEKDK